jgi:hypothetical protein
VAAAYLAAVLCKASARGLLGQEAREVRTQAAAQGEPLDDIVVEGSFADGRATKLCLRVKTEVRFTASDPEWVAVLEAAWDTFARPDFDIGCHRIGVAVANYDTKIDKYYQSVLTWATHSADAEGFFQRIEKRDFSHAEKREFVEVVRSILMAHVGRAATNDELWRFFRSFVILHFDLNLEERSRDSGAVVDRIRDLLSQDAPQQAAAVWGYLVKEAGELIPAGGTATRASLVEALTAANLPAGTPISYRADIETLNRESELTLAEIRSDIAGLKLFRATAYERLRTALNEARFLQIDGEPGTGKSALLKMFAQECARSGPILVLKDRRIHPRGWSAHAHVLNVCNDPGTILREFGCSGEPILFIDGIDKIDDPGEQMTVNDLVRTVAESEFLERWRIVVTVRGQNLRHIETWLDAAALRKLGLATVTVETLGRDELALVAAAQPRLVPLLQQSNSLDVILSRPFFIDALLTLAERSPTTELPATEVDLLCLWWRLGGADREEFSAAQHRRNALMQLAQLLARTPNGALSIANVAPDPIAELKTAGVLRDRDLGHSVIFTHDIYEEWTLCEFLLAGREEIGGQLTAAGESQALVRPLQLLGTHLLETESSTLPWETLLAATASEQLRPVWQRAVLSAPLQSTRAALLLEKLSDLLLSDSALRLRRLLTAIRTIEVVPNPHFLNVKTFADIEPAERVKLAEATALPKTAPWLRLLGWLVPRFAILQPQLIPDLLPVCRTWQDAWAGRNVRYCREIGTEAYRWLQEFEGAKYARNWGDHRDPFGVHFRHAEEVDFEKSIRQLFLTSAGDVRELTQQYLSDIGRDDRRCYRVRDEVLASSAQLVRHLPKELVDFIFSAFLESPDEQDDGFGSSHMRLSDELGVAGHQSFYPASPLRMPFLPLLRLDEVEGLRLIRGICNHSINAWRWARSHPHHYSPATPIPITVEFPWGKQTFWGDAQVYLWFRGIWGNSASKSALMAQEQWALERLDAGEDFALIFQKCIEGHESVAALGLGLSLCLAKTSKSIECAFPLVTSA